MYVAMTRARNALAVVYPLNSYATPRSGDYSIDQLSRFLDRGVQAQMQKVVLQAEDPTAGAEAPREKSEGAIDLRAILRGRFGK